MSFFGTQSKAEKTAEQAAPKRTGDLPDRRNRPTNPLSRDSLFGRRSQIRRESDRDLHYYVDRYEPTSALLFITVIVLSTLDALFTLRLVGSGGREINPVMDFFLDWGPLPFLFVKYLLSGGALLFVLIHKEYYLRLGKLRLKSRNLLLIVLALYLALITYELYLLSYA